MAEIDREAFSTELKNIAQGDDSPYASLSRARNEVAEAELSPIAYSLIVGWAVKMQYDQAQEHLEKQLSAGADNMHAVLTALNQVLQNYENVEDANIVAPGAFGVSEVEQSGPFRIREIVPGAGMAGVGRILGMKAIMALKNSAIVGVSGAMTKMAVTGAIATALWIAFTPDDGAIEEIHARWSAAASELDSFGDEVMNMVNRMTRSWDDSAAEAFQEYMNNLNNEVQRCYEAVDGCASGVTSMHDAIVAQQTNWLIMALANLVAIIAMWVTGKAFPPAEGAMQIAMNVVAALFGVTTGSLIVWAFTTLKTLATAVWAIASASSINADALDGEEVDLESVAMDESAINELTSGLSE